MSRVEGLGLRVQGLGFRVQGSGFVVCAGVDFDGDGEGNGEDAHATPCFARGIEQTTNEKLCKHLIYLSIYIYIYMCTCIHI